MIKQEYGEGSSPTMVHRDVAAIITHLNSLEAMTLRIQIGSTIITGKLQFTESGCVLTGAAVTVGS